MVCLCSNTVQNIHGGIHLALAIGFQFFSLWFKKPSVGGILYISGIRLILYYQFVIIIFKIVCGLGKRHLYIRLAYIIVELFALMPSVNKYKIQYNTLSDIYPLLRSSIKEKK